ncbi:MAG: hypothetical protein LBC53_04095 [Spirochaetaceae bacterium]|jgi:hypothetical protein|nr:hypothetical protein [Spirochaetaceae bacterium]
MKKAWIVGLVFVFASFPVIAQSGVYFDIGLGFGKAWTKISDQDVADAFNNAGLDLTDVGVNLGVKIGYGPFGNVPFYIVADLGGIGHRLEGSGFGSMQFNTYVIGPGIIFYPAPLVQISADIGFSTVANQFALTGISLSPAKSEKGFAWDVSLALDIGKANHGFLIGVSYFGAKNSLETGANEDASFAGIFFKYAYRHKIKKIIANSSLK